MKHTLKTEKRRERLKYIYRERGKKEKGTKEREAPLSLFRTWGQPGESGLRERNSLIALRLTS